MGVKAFGIFLVFYALAVGYLIKNGTPDFLKAQVVTEEDEILEAGLPGHLTKREPAGHSFDKIIASAQALEAIKGMILGEKLKPVELKFLPRDPNWGEVILVGVAQALPVTTLFFVLGLIFTGRTAPPKEIKNQNMTRFNLGIFKREHRYLESGHSQIRYEWNIGVYKGVRAFEVPGKTRSPRSLGKAG